MLIQLLYKQFLSLLLIRINSLLQFIIWNQMDNK